MAELSHEHMWDRVGEGAYGTIYRCSRCGKTETWAKTAATPSTDEAVEAIDEEDD